MRQTLLARIYEAVGSQPYLTPIDEVFDDHRAALREISVGLQSEHVDADRLRRMVDGLHQAGDIGPVLHLSALGVIAAHPKVRDYAEGCRLAEQQELVALDLGGPRLQANLASADRHRGVLAFLMGRYGVALEWFIRALERQRTAENLGNVLCTLLRLGEIDEARELLRTIRDRFPPGIADGVQVRIEQDEDLRGLR